MADTLTLAKSLTEQTVGGNSNTWGGILNDTIELIDQALGQTVTIAITGNTTITADQAKNIGYKFTGTPGGNKTVSWPTYYGPLVVKNAMTDGSAAVCGMASGGTVTVYAGDSAIIFSDGADFVQTPRRRVLTADTTFVVNFTTGNDTTGNGSTAAPWKTLQKAIDWLVLNVDGGGKVITIEQAGVDTTGVVILHPVIGAASVFLELNGGINTSNPYGVYVSGLDVEVAITSTGTVIGATEDLVAANGATLLYQGITLGACSGAKVLAQTSGKVFITGSYGETGNSYAHWRADTGGIIAFQQAATLTQSGTPSYTAAFAIALINGAISCVPATFAGTGAVGARYLTATGGGIDRGANDLPGNAAGTATAATYGWYA